MVLVARKPLAVLGLTHALGCSLLLSEAPLLATTTQTLTKSTEPKKNIPELYEQHEDKLSGSTAYLYVSVDAYAPEQFLDHELTTRMINMFKDELQMNPHIVRYTEASALVMDKDGEIRECFKGAEMQGRLLVIGGGGKKPQVDFVTQDMQLNP